MSERFDLQSQFDHERVLIERRPEVGLTAIVAIHSTALGPGEGGLRCKSYARIDDAIVDALRLSAAMTLKSAAAGLPFGGGKAVMLPPPPELPREVAMHAMGEFVESLGGAFIVGPDSGTGTADMDLILDRTRHVVGFSPERGGLGDPSPSTAVTVLGAIRHALRLREDDGLAGRTVGVLGVGKVGGRLAELLAAEGARVTIADVDAERAAAVAAATGAEAVPVEGFLERSFDVLSPCATGELIDPGAAAALDVKIVAGSANNPLTADPVAGDLHRRGIFYVPDFIANSGGVIYNSIEYRRGGQDDVEEALELAIGRAGQVLEEALRESRDPLEVAREFALARVAEAQPG